MNSWKGERFEAMVAFARGVREELYRLPNWLELAAALALTMV